MMYRALDAVIDIDFDEKKIDGKIYFGPEMHGGPNKITVKSYDNFELNRIIFNGEKIVAFGNGAELYLKTFLDGELATVKVLVSPPITTTLPPVEYSVLMARENSKIINQSSWSAPIAKNLEWIEFLEEAMKNGYFHRAIIRDSSIEVGLRVDDVPLVFTYTLYEKGEELEGKWSPAVAKIELNGLEAKVKVGPSIEDIEKFRALLQCTRL